MTDAMMSRHALLEKTSDPDVLREMIGFAAERLTAQQVGRLFDAQCGGGFVQDQHAGAEIDGAGDGQRLPFAARHPADPPVAIVDPGDAELTHRFDCNLVGGFAVTRAALLDGTLTW